MNGGAQRVHRIDAYVVHARSEMSKERVANDSVVVLIYSLAEPCQASKYPISSNKRRSVYFGISDFGAALVQERS